MDTIQISKQNAIAAHEVADSKGKKMLETLLGAEVFSRDIKDRVKTLQDACLIVGIDYSDLLDTGVCAGLADDLRSIQAYKQLIIIARALNEGWVPDWTNGNEAKYYPWFNASAGSGLSFDVYAYTRSHSAVCSRLCFKSRELAEYAAKQFIDIYNEFFLIK